MKYYIYLFFFITVVTQNNVHAQVEDKIVPGITVEGEVAQPLTLSQSDLAKMKRMTVRYKGNGNTTHTYAGVPVLEILKKAGVTLGSELRGKNLTKYLLVVGADGYKVIFSLAELDTIFNNKQIILSDKMDGKPLSDHHGPFQLIIPGEKKPTRNCRQVISFIIGSAKD